MHELSEIADKEYRCSTELHMKSHECSGIIAIGERYSWWKGVSKEIVKGDFDHPDNRYLLCRHCVRAANDAMADKSKPIITKIEITYSTGERRVLEGEDADDWEAMSGGQAVMAWAHGYQGKALNWKVYDKNGKLVK